MTTTTTTTTTTTNTTTTNTTTTTTITATTTTATPLRHHHQQQEQKPTLVTSCGFLKEPSARKAATTDQPGKVGRKNQQWEKGTNDVFVISLLNLYFFLRVSTHQLVIASYRSIPNLRDDQFVRSDTRNTTKHLLSPWCVFAARCLSLSSFVPVYKWLILFIASLFASRSRTTHYSGEIQPRWRLALYRQ
jgi:hypothetical protein